MRSLGILAAPNMRNRKQKSRGASEAASPLPFTKIAIAFVIALAPIGANATGVADGAAGMAALERGDYKVAISLFTRALKAGDLRPQDQELAYLKRGEAELGLGLMKAS